MKLPKTYDGEGGAGLYPAFTCRRCNESAMTSSYWGSEPYARAGAVLLFLNENNASILEGTLNEF